MKSGNLKIVQIHSLVISTRDIHASKVKWSPPTVSSTLRIDFELN